MSRTVATKVTEPETLLLRQASPSQLTYDGSLTSAIFKPSQEHGFLLSTLHGRVGAEEAHRRHCEAGYQSAGTWGLSINEVKAAGLAAWEDGDTTPETPIDHVTIPMQHIGRSQRERKAKQLKEAADARGRLFPTSS